MDRESEGHYPRLRIIHLPTDVGGNAYGLSRGERILGHTSDILTRDLSFVGYPADRTIVPFHITRVYKAAPYAPRVVWEVLRTACMYDVIHCNYGSSILDLSAHAPTLFSHIDLPLYSAMKRVIAVTYNGCDARQRDKVITRKAWSACHEENCYQGRCLSGIETDRIRERIQKVARYADITYALNPDLVPLLPEGTEFLPYSIAQWNEIPHIAAHARNTHVPPSQEMRPYTPDNPFTIVHAPSDRGAKGTRYIMEALSDIVAEYKGSVRCVLVENHTHTDALQKYATADLVIDQVLIGWYGATTVESLRMGIPSLAYIYPGDLDYIPPAMARDVISAIPSPDTHHTIAHMVRDLIEDPTLIARFRHNGIAYVHRWHDPVMVAMQTTKAYSDAKRRA